jgi:hypothetical protein
MSGPGTIRRVRVKNQTTSAVAEGTPPAGHAGGAARLGVDYKNKTVYAVFNSAPFGLFTIDEDLTNPVTLLLSASGERIISAVCPNAALEQVFFAAVTDPSPTTAYLKRVNYDGTGETAILTFAGVPVGDGVTAIQASKDGSHVFYIFTRQTAGASDEVRRCNPDGSGDTLLYTAPADSALHTTIGIDHDHEKILFADNGNPVGYTRTIKRCGWDGSNLETLLTSTTTPRRSMIMSGWSHIKKRIYFFDQADGTNNNNVSGWWSMAYDGSGLIREVPGVNWGKGFAGGGTNNTNQARLWCGYERTGAGYQS